MAINLESGNFSPPHLTTADDALDRASDNPGAQRFEKAVPGAWLDANGYAVLAAEIDKLWIPEKREAKPLGFILVSLGLEQK